jgi:hypothetical protein
LASLVNSSNTGTLGVAGLTTLNTLGVTGLTTLANTSNTGTLGVAGATTLNTLGVTGLTTLANTSNTGTLGVAGATTLNTLGVTGLTTLANTSNTGTLGVAGNVTFGANIYLPLGASGKGISAHSFTTNGNINDTLNNAPSYGMGVTSNFTGLGPYTNSSTQPLQIAHYYGINFVGGTGNWVNNASHMAIVDGKVGIQNKNPQYALDVNGNVGVSGGITATAGSAIHATGILTSAGNCAVGQNGGTYIDLGGPFGAGNSGSQITMHGNASVKGGLAVDGSLGATGGFYGRLITNTWIQSTDSQNRLYFANNDHTFIGTTAGFGWYFQNNNGNVCNVTNGGDIYANGNITAYSDVRKKENIVTIDSALDKVMAMRGVYYTRKDIPGPRQLGLIAQEVEAVVPEVVLTDSEGMKSVAYANIVGLLIEAIKTQQSTIDSLVAKCL